MEIKRVKAITINTVKEEERLTRIRSKIIKNHKKAKSRGKNGPPGVAATSR